MNTDDKYFRIWEYFNHNGQSKFGLAMLYLEKGDVATALKYMNQLQAVWDETLKIK